MSKSKVYQQLGINLSTLRKQKELSQSEVAKMFDMPQSTYAGYEAAVRKPPLEIITALADYFGVSVDYLLGRSHDAYKSAETISSRYMRDNLVGSRIQETREGQSLSPKALGDKIGVSQDMIELYENVNEYIVKIPLEQLSEALGVSERFLMGWQEAGEYQFLDNEYLGDRLQKIRLAAGRTREYTAEALGIPLMTLDDLENNVLVIDRETRKKYSLLFGVHPEIMRMGILFTEKHSETLDNDTRDNQKLVELERHYTALNEDGQDKLLDYAEDLTSSGRYTRQAE